MPKALTIVGMIIAGLLLVIFGLDLAFKLFGRASMTMSISFVIFSLVLGYLSWSTWRELT